jgi:1-acyl-sn-glycerol-3-phosphate acyltransferase
MTPTQLPKSPFVRLMRTAMVWLAKRQGWRVIGSPPDTRKFVIIAAPHSSNWDFVYFIVAAESLGLDLSYMGKKALFRWPFGGFMTAMGGVPVDRSSSNNAVEQMIAEFARRDSFMLTIAPEGTRSAVQQWKTGFYHIAHGAKVPMVCATIDYRLKLVDLGPAIWPSGDYEKDMAEVRVRYANCTPKNPRLGHIG